MSNNGKLTVLVFLFLYLLIFPRKVLYLKCVSFFLFSYSKGRDSQETKRMTVKGDDDTIITPMVSYSYLNALNVMIQYVCCKLCLVGIITAAVTQQIYGFICFNADGKSFHCHCLPNKLVSTSVEV